FGGEIDHAAVEAPELGGGGVGLDVEFLNGVDDGREGDLAGFGLKDGDAIVEIFVGAGAAAVKAGKLAGAGRQGDAGGKADQVDKAAAVERQRGDGQRLDGLGHGAGVGAQGR